MAHIEHQQLSARTTAQTCSVRSCMAFSSRPKAEHCSVAPTLTRSYLGRLGRADRSAAPALCLLRLFFRPAHCT